MEIGTIYPRRRPGFKFGCVRTAASRGRRKLRRELVIKDGTWHQHWHARTAESPGWPPTPGLTTCVRAIPPCSAVNCRFDSILHAVGSTWSVNRDIGPDSDLRGVAGPTRAGAVGPNATLTAAVDACWILRSTKCRVPPRPKTKARVFALLQLSDPPTPNSLSVQNL